MGDKSPKNNSKAKKQKANKNKPVLETLAPSSPVNRGLSN
jgi:hypothetical protein